MPLCVMAPVIIAVQVKLREVDLNSFLPFGAFVPILSCPLQQRKLISKREESF